MQELICFSAFLYQYIEFFVFLKPVARRGGYPPLNPPLYRMIVPVDILHRIVVKI